MKLLSWCRERNGAGEVCRGFFPAARRILLPLLLEIYLSAILLSDVQRHCASTGYSLYAVLPTCDALVRKKHTTVIAL